MARLALILVLCSAVGYGSELLITVKNTRENQGGVTVSLFNSKDTFLQEPLLERKRSVGSNQQVQVSFADLPTGDYAVVVVYDVNGNGKLDTGLFRIPKEPVAFSNDARGTFGPPSFEQCVFRHGERSQEVIVHLKKVKKS